MQDGPAPDGIERRQTDSDPPKHAYYVLAESACPYLPGKRERKLITEITGRDATARYTLLSRAGFRRSHQFAYRPACAGCSACIPVRVDVGAFIISRSLRRIARANVHLRAEHGVANATTEQYELFDRYLQQRHGNGEMAGMTVLDYQGMVQNSRVDSRIVEFRDEIPKGTAGKILRRALKEEQDA